MCIRDRRRDSASAFERASTRRRVFSASFPTLLDDYVLRDFFVYLGMILSSFLVLLLVFTLFELLGDILRNQTPPTVVAEYLLNNSNRVNTSSRTRNDDRIIPRYTKLSLIHI